MRKKLQMETESIMSDKKTNIWLVLLFALGGGFFILELAKLLSKNKYSCPKCGKTITYHDEKCKHCHEPLEWNF